MKGDISQLTPFFPETAEKVYESPISTFKLFFDEEIINHIYEQTSIYAKGKNDEQVITKEDIWCVLGILILSGYHSLPGFRYYWDSDDDFGVPLVRSSMRRNKFIGICRLLHFVDNGQLDENDKLWKLRPLITMLQKKMMENFHPTKHLSYDESMVRYFGHHGLKQYMKNKQSKFGYKVWSPVKGILHWLFCKLSF